MPSVKRSSQVIAASERRAKSLLDLTDEINAIQTYMLNAQYAGTFNYLEVIR